MAFPIDSTNFRQFSFAHGNVTIIHLNKESSVLINRPIKRYLVSKTILTDRNGS